MTFRKNASWKGFNITPISVPSPYPTKVKSIKLSIKWSQTLSIVWVGTLQILLKRNLTCGKFHSGNHWMLILKKTSKQKNKKSKRSKRSGWKEQKRKNGPKNKTKPWLRTLKTNSKPKPVKNSSTSFKAFKMRPSTLKFKKSLKMILLTQKSIFCFLKEWKQWTNTLWKVKRSSWSSTWNSRTIAKSSCKNWMNTWSKRRKRRKSWKMKKRTLTQRKKSLLLKKKAKNNKNNKSLLLLTFLQFWINKTGMGSLKLSEASSKDLLTWSSSAALIVKGWVGAIKVWQLPFYWSIWRLSSHRLSSWLMNNSSKLKKN